MSEEQIELLRNHIYALDSELRSVISERNDAVSALSATMEAAGLPVWDQTYVDDVIDEYVDELGEIAGTRIATAIIGTQQELEELSNGE